MKKILLCTRPIIPPWDEASKNLAYDIARNCEGDFEFHSLTVKNSGFKVKSLENTPQVSEEIYASPHLGSREKYQLLRRIFRANLDADILHFLFTPRPLTSWLFRMRLSASKVKTIQTIATVNEKLYANPEKLKKIFFADVIIAQSNYTKEKLLKTGINNVRMIYPGIDLNKYKPCQKDVSLMQNLGIKNNDLVILFAGEYTRLKAIDDIVESFRIIFSSVYNLPLNIKLILACRIKSKEDKFKKKEVIEKIKQLGYYDKVIFLDTFAEMDKLYNLSDINIFPVREMTGKFDIPLAVVEPMACKKPVIISDIPVLMEFIENDETGIITEKANPRKLANEIISLIQDEERRKKIGTAAADYVKNNFDIRQNVKLYEEIYNKL